MNTESYMAPKNNEYLVKRLFAVVQAIAVVT